MRTQPINLGTLISLLAARNPAETVEFDFGGLVPDVTHFLSYRGWYEHLALGFSPRTSYPEPTVATVKSALEGLIGKFLTGYKGGEYRMTDRTPVWVSQWGDVSNTSLVGLDPVSRGVTVLQTAYCAEWEGSPNQELHRRMAGENNRW